MCCVSRLGTPSLTTTHASPSGQIGRVERIRRVARPKVDCFYVYPTVSDNEGANADRSNSIYNGPVPEDSRFGRTTEANREVLCTNPASLRGGAGTIDPIQPTAPFAPGTTIAAGIGLLGNPVPDVSTAWYQANDAYRARCVSEDGANVLQVASRGGAPVLRPVPDTTWGLHLTDANLPLGDLASLAKRQTGEYGRRR